jgi:hypothetical protein
VRKFKANLGRFQPRDREAMFAVARKPLASSLRKQAKAETHTPRLIDETLVSDTLCNNSRRRLGVPAFSGTTLRVIARSPVALLSYSAAISQFSNGQFLIRPHLPAE